MRVVVIGGTGLIGTPLVRRLTARGHDAVAASPTTGVNTITRVGLAAVLVDADVVVDVSDPPSFDDADVVELVCTSARNLSAAELSAGVGHHVGVSIVGAERLAGSGYMRAKVAQETVVRSAGVPFTILRSTQSFELLRAVGDAATDGDVVRVSPASVRPVAARDIAEALGDLCDRRPVDSIEELAGPETLRLTDVVARVMTAERDARRVEATPEARFYGTRLSDDTLLPGPHARLGPTHLDDWLAEHVISTPPAGGLAR
jgi:uncharacterized protein YbjT (DUF2867 family)